MTIPALIEEAVSSHGNRRSARRKLRLQLHGTNAVGGDLNVSVHNISATGLLLEGDAALAIGDDIDIILPHAGATRAKVIWISGVLYGCQFETPISTPTLSAAQLRAVVGTVHQDVVPDTPVIESLGDRLHRLRSSRRLTQVQVAPKLGVSEQSISAWEQDKARPKAGRMKALAALLDVELAELLGIEERRSLSDVVAHAKAQVAEAADVSTDHVKIIIEI